MGSRLSTLSSQLRRAPRGGFALLIVVTLLAFIVLLLVGLAAFTRVETSIAGNTQRQAQARENALLALNVALGQLQKHAGPDKRITATADAFPNGAGTTRYTGVWASDPADDPDGDPLTPLTWLVSGNELFDSSGAPLPLAVPPGSTVTATGATPNGVALVSTNTSRTANDVLARLMPITAAGVPGAAPTGPPPTIGRYAWWVGDQGVKAPVAVADASTQVNYPPFGDGTAQTDLGRRIRQQVALGAGALDLSASPPGPAFEPRDANNAPLVAGQKVSHTAQLAFLRNAANTQLGLTRAQQNFHAWSPNNFAVLADTKNGGLRQDLSLDPTLLGSAFAAWADYATHMEPPVPGAVSPPVPDYGAEPIRRRHVLTPHLVDGGGSHQIGPVLTYFLLTFNVRTIGNSRAANAPLEVRALWTVSLWNPYTAALVPEDLQITVTGLPSTVSIVNDNPARAIPFVGSFSPGAVFGSPFTISLPWPSAPVPNGAVLEDRASWLPGRTHSWRSIEDKSGSGPAAAGYDSFFGARDFNSSGEGVVFPLSGLSIADGDDDMHIEVDGSTNLVVTVNVLRAGGPVRLGRFQSSNFVPNFPTVSQAAELNGKQFTYVFRLAEGLDTPATPGVWLTTDGRDVRRRTLPSEAFLPEAAGDNPASYDEKNLPSVVNPDRLLDRAPGSFTYNEDAPVFELPRAPFLSLGALQHLRMIGRRPFMIGNSWGVAETLNGIPLGEIFDRFFFSGLVAGVSPVTSPAGDLVLPNPLLRPLRLADGARPTETDLRALPEARSSARLLQSAAFNLNSTNPAAWAAVLRSVRFPAQPSSPHNGAFRYLEVSDATGTADDSAVAPLQSGDAQFLRFSQSAQETYKAEAGFAAGAASPASPAATHLFRRGVKSLAAPQVAALADAVAAAVKARQQTSGPFRTVAEFLTPSVPNTPSLLEQAIIAADAVLPVGGRINRDAADNPIEFSSQFLTQADIMTALAPVLFPRSDTFVIRAYGEAVNPATNATEGRAWCEATVQRVPDYMDPSEAPEVLPANLASELNKQLGRRFKVVSFRWLTRSDI